MARGKKTIQWDVKHDAYQEKCSSWMFSSYSDNHTILNLVTCFWRPDFTEPHFNWNGKEG